MNYEAYHEAARAASSVDPAHDHQHVLRVAANAQKIIDTEGGNPDVIIPAVLLHELFSYPKNHPLSKYSGDECANRAEKVLRTADYPTQNIPLVLTCIRDHSFSKGVVPTALEGKIVQDADRLDAIGAIGIARMFATCAQMERPFYHPTDPFCEHRPPDDKSYGMDHLYTKLLHLCDQMHTKTAHQMARQRTDYMRGFIAQWQSEL